LTDLKVYVHVSIVRSSLGYREDNELGAVCGS
jgi:hypothetical protein